jgi:nucleoside-diphosphate-sugar epimerase
VNCVDELQDFIQPAIRGTLGVLRSALKFGLVQYSWLMIIFSWIHRTPSSAKIKRIVITSSCAAILQKVTEPTITFDETSWGDDFVRAVEEQGRDAPMIFKYRASKTLAERGGYFRFEDPNAK